MSDQRKYEPVPGPVSFRKVPALIWWALRRTFGFTSRDPSAPRQ